MSAQILAVICGLAGALGVGVGAGLLLVTRCAPRERARLRRWLLDTDLIALADRRRMIERFLYRHHRAFGAAVVVGAAASLGTLWQLRDYSPVRRLLHGVLGAPGLTLVILASWALLVFALCIGTFLVLRPSALKRFETMANRWIEPFPYAGAPAGGALIPRIVLRAPTVTAMLLLGAGSICLQFASAAIY